MQNEDTSAFRRKGDLGVPFVIALFALSIIIGWVVFRNYENSAKEITASLARIQEESKTFTITDCAGKTMEWFSKCDAMTQLCDSTVPRMIKVCLANSDKSSQCPQYGNEIYGYNFGAKQCKQYMHGSKMKRNKKACGDVWQVIAEYCKDAAKVTMQKTQ
ncbi:hypothetical protein [Silvanigrella sp.]|jgi:hypothetical protein|uniref:hypothetical protein n=1 Tax=Silvanigrella sp. TaxID=2024976 RepID=UPI0037C81B37